ncbi:MAG TPA: hypothetical protein VM075_04780 [Anaerolineae bacterium]|nr:hypothetical protein [Anaerolineae bacterium]
MTVARAVMSVMVCTLAAACSTPEGGKPTLEYTVGGCSEESENTRAATGGEVDIIGQGDTIHVSQKLTYVCCAELELTTEQEDSTIKLLEKNIGEICRCLCDYEVEADITGLSPGVYQVEVWGVEYEDVHIPELLGQATIRL